MRIAYFDCFSGIAGDMCLGALLDAGANVSLVESAIASLGIEASLEVHHVKKHGFRGVAIRVVHPEQHAHRTLRDIHHIVQRGDLVDEAKALALSIFERIARAEAKVHGTTVDRVTFHEVGAVDSIVDVVGAAVAWTDLGIDKAYASPVPTGTGWVDIAHGRVAIPAPATAELLTGVPIAPCSITKEMTTPTGIGILRTLVESYGPMPSLQVSRIGYGAGTRDLEDRPNLLRVLVGESVAGKPQRHAKRSDAESVLVLETNLDDMSGEAIGYAVERLWDAGALDVFLTPIQMKKGRPATLLTVLSRPEDRVALERVLFEHTLTLGVRWRIQSRTVLPRAAVDVDTPWGVVPGKVSRMPDGRVDFSPEYEACREIALEEGLRLADVMDEVRQCFVSEQEPKVLEVDDRYEPHGLEQKDAPELEGGNASRENDDATWYRWDSSPWNES